MDPKAQSIQQMLETLSYAGQSNQILNPTQLIDILTDLPSFEPDLSVELLQQLVQLLISKTNSCNAVCSTATNSINLIDTVAQLLLSDTQENQITPYLYSILSALSAPNQIQSNLFENAHQFLIKTQTEQACLTSLKILKSLLTPEKGLATFVCFPFGSKLSVKPTNRFEFGKDFSFFLSIELSKCDQPIKLISMRSHTILYDFFIVAGTLNFRSAKSSSPIKPDEGKVFLSNISNEGPIKLSLRITKNSVETIINNSSKKKYGITIDLSSAIEEIVFFENLHGQMEYVVCTYAEQLNDQAKPLFSYYAELINEQTHTFPPMKNTLQCNAAIEGSVSVIKNINKLKLKRIGSFSMLMPYLEYMTVCKQSITLNTFFECLEQCFLLKGEYEQLDNNDGIKKMLIILPVLIKAIPFIADNTTLEIISRISSIVYTITICNETKKDKTLYTTYVWMLLNIGEYFVNCQKEELNSTFWLIIKDLYLHSNCYEIFKEAKNINEITIQKDLSLTGIIQRLHNLFPTPTQSTAPFSLPIVELIKSVALEYEVKGITPPLIPLLKVSYIAPQIVYLLNTIALQMREEIETTGVSEIEEVVLYISSKYGKQEFCYCAYLLSILSKFNGTLNEKDMIDTLVSILPTLDQVQIAIPIVDLSAEIDEVERMMKEQSQKNENTKKEVQMLVKNIRECTAEVAQIKKENIAKAENIELKKLTQSLITPPPPPRGKKKAFFPPSDESDKQSVPIAPINSEPSIAAQPIEIKKMRGKPAFKKPLNIDTDAINRSMPIGGEMGVLHNCDDNQRDEDEILALARYCIRAMERKSENDPIEEQEEVKQVRPVSVKGKQFTKHDFQKKLNMAQFFNEENKSNKGMNPIIEVPSPISTSKSSSTKHNEGTTNIRLPTQTRDNSFNDTDIMLSNTIFGWISHKLAITNIDDTMKVLCPHALKLLIKQSENSGYALKSMVIQMLDSLGNQNQNMGSIITFPGLLVWLLDTIFNAKKDQNQMTYELGFKFLHHAILNRFMADENAHQLIQILVSWTDEVKVQTSKEIWFSILTELEKNQLKGKQYKLWNRNVASMALYILQLISNSGKGLVLCDSQIMTKYINFYYNCILAVDQPEWICELEDTKDIMAKLMDLYGKCQSKIEECYAYTVNSVYSVSIFIDILIYAFVDIKCEVNPSLLSKYAISIINCIEFSKDRKVINNLSNQIIKLLTALGSISNYDDLINQIFQHIFILRKAAQAIPGLASLTNDKEIIIMIQNSKEKSLSYSSQMTPYPIPPVVLGEWIEKLPKSIASGEMSTNSTYYEYITAVVIRKWRKERERLMYWGGVWRNQAILESGNLTTTRHRHENQARIPNLLVSSTKAIKYISSNDNCSSNTDYCNLFKEVNSVVEIYSELTNIDEIKKYVDQLYKSKLSLECEIVKLFYNIKGTLSIINGNIVFIKDITQNSKPTNSLFAYKFKVGYQIVKKWKIKELLFAFPKKYTNINTSYQLFLATHRSVIFNFPNLENLKQFINALKDSISELGIGNQLNFGIGSAINNAASMAPYICDKWVKREITNFEYLMWLNHLSSRSFNDISQYPIFPWILNSLKNNPSLDSTLEIYRKFDQPIGINNKRNSISSEKHTQEESQANDPYSSYAENVYSLLTRLHPFFEGYLQQNSGKKEIPTKIFNCFLAKQNSDESDMNELVPELFYLPEMLMNLNHVKLGKGRDSLIGDVTIPEWINDHYEFIMLHRQCLESDYVDRNISLWIDQVFGYKQKGEDAKRPNTLSTNADQVKPISFNMQDDKISSDTKLLQTGQAPTQLFKKVHTKRMNISEANESSYKVYKPKEAKLGLKIVYIQGCSYDGSRYLTFKINPSLYGEANISQSMQKAKPISDKINIYKIDLQSSNSNEAPFKCSGEKDIELSQKSQKFPKDTTISYNSQLYACKFTESKQFLFIGGYVRGMILLCEIKQKGEENHFYRMHTTTVTALAIDANQKYLITGSKDGDTAIWKLGIISDTINVFRSKVMYHHQATVTHIHIDTQSGLFATGSYDGKIYLYEIGKSSILKAFSHPSHLPITGMAISECPYLVLTYFNSGEGVLRVEHINVNKRSEIKLECSVIKQMMKHRSKNLSQCLMVGVDNSIMKIQFERQQVKQIMSSFTGDAMHKCADDSIILFGSDEGQLIIAIKSNDSNNKLDHSFKLN